MATSQFSVYTYLDAGAPVLSGSTGSLVNTLTKILVTGYGSKPGAGWTADYVSGSPVTGSTFRPASGSRFFMSVTNDCGGAAVQYGEARIRCFETMSAFNTGSMPFPMLGQGVSSLGYCSVRYSVTSASRGSPDLTASVVRPWICFADAYTMYFFVQPEGNPTPTVNYHNLWFGDFYSLKPNDPYNCMLSARDGEGGVGAVNWDLQYWVNAAMVGTYIARNYWGGFGGSVRASQHGNIAFSGGSATATAGVAACVSPNPENNALYMCPLWLCEITNVCIRGRYRGLYFMAAPIANYADGQQFSGSNEYAGKIFQVVKPGYNNGMVAVEISNTVETN